MVIIRCSKCHLVEIAVITIYTQHSMKNVQKLHDTTTHRWDHIQKDWVMITEAQEFTSNDNFNT
jgi:hypothetical protein